MGPALAEVEVTAKVAGDAAPKVSFIRGDADCDTHINMTDAMVVLNRLFLGGGPLCCNSAGDINADGHLDITDPILLLGYEFLGTDGLPEPWPNCGQAADEGDLLCDQETCP